MLDKEDIFFASDKKPVAQQDYHYQVDQQVSVNSFIDIEVEGETVRFQVTSRYGSNPEKIVKTARANIEAYTLLRQEFPRNFVVPPPPVVVRQPIDDSGNELPTIKSFTADRLSVEFKDGKFYYKVIGAPFTKYGVNVWGEVLEACGITVDHANPNNPPNIAGWKAEYIEKESNGKMVPAKVTRLLLGKAPF
jgi:hypothetical protein